MLLHRIMSAMGKTVLVIDDHEDVRDSVSLLLEDAGYETVTAANGAVALVAVQRTRPDCILLDLMMPVMTGWEVVERLQKDPALARIPVIVLTAGGFDPPGQVKLLRKPFDVSRLLDEIARSVAAA